MQGKTKQKKPLQDQSINLKCILGIDNIAVMKSKKYVQYSTTKF
jgi:hypothetical protein